jgi:hypothetical protein
MRVRVCVCVCVCVCARVRARASRCGEFRFIFVPCINFLWLLIFPIIHVVESG